MSCYADFEFYSAQFLGGLIPAGAFSRLSARAGDYIDYITSGRATDTSPVKKACCALAEVLYSEEQRRGERGEIAGESNDGVSVTYREEKRALERRMFDTALRYLDSTGLLYCGV